MVCRVLPGLASALCPFSSFSQVPPLLLTVLQPCWPLGSLLPGALEHVLPLLLADSYCTPRPLPQCHFLTEATLTPLHSASSCIFPYGTYHSYYSMINCVIS